MKNQGCSEGYEEQIHYMNAKSHQIQFSKLKTERIQRCRRTEGLK